MTQWINQKILWLDISVNYPKSVNISKSPKDLIAVELDKKYRDLLSKFTMLLKNSENCLRYILHHNIQVKFIILIKLNKIMSLPFRHE